jgi:hypothetical protein
MNNDILIQKYNQGCSLQEIGREFGLSPMTVHRRLKGKINPRTRKHVLRDENFLKKINSEWKAYFLGLLWADGNMRSLDNKTNKSCSINISLVSSDADILKSLWSEIFISPVKLSLKKARKYTDKKTSKDFYGQESSKLIINSKIIYNDLLNLGCSPCKSTSAIMPDIPENLFRHFVRGYFDGDGWMDSSRYSCGCIGSKEFCSSLRQKIAEFINVDFKYIEDGKMARLLCFNKKGCAKLAHWIYEGSNFQIERKKIKFDRLQN